MTVLIQTYVLFNYFLQLLQAQIGQAYILYIFRTQQLQ